MGESWDAGGVEAVIKAENLVLLDSWAIMSVRDVVASCRHTKQLRTLTQMKLAVRQLAVPKISASMVCIMNISKPNAQNLHTRATPHDPQ